MNDGTGFPPPPDAHHVSFGVIQGRLFTDIPGLSHNFRFVGDSPPIPVYRSGNYGNQLFSYGFETDTHIWYSFKLSGSVSGGLRS